MERVKFIATDGATNYFRKLVDAMDDEMFDLWMRYHLTVCERPELIGASHHTLGYHADVKGALSRCAFFQRISKPGKYFRDMFGATA